MIPKSMVTDSDSVKIEFPCAYPIKILGFATDGFETDVVSIVKSHARLSSGHEVTVRPSGKGNYLAVTVIIEATGETQLKCLFDDLMAAESVKLVL
ncbi:MAG: DUF493 domain-containing protein [Pseudohongiellaceae bacterium]